MISISRQRAWQIANPEKAAAQAAVSSAIRDGRLVKPATCSQCPSPKPQAHHADYAKPLEVEWLCRACHAARHVALRVVEPSRIAALAEAQRAYLTKHEAMHAARTERDRQVIAALEARIPQADIMESTGLSRARLTQIKRGTR